MTPENTNSQSPALAVAPGSPYLPPDRWVDVDKALAIIRDERWTWALNARCKYITLRIDTRDGHCLIKDRDGKEITLKELSRQGDAYLANDAAQPTAPLAHENSNSPEKP